MSGVSQGCATGSSIVANAGLFGTSRDSMKKITSFSVSPVYRRTAAIKQPKLGGFPEIIDHFLQEDLSRNRKQHHTAKRIFERLHDEHGFTTGNTSVKNQVRAHERQG